MAIVYSLPWALVMWSYVVRCLPRCTFQLIFTEFSPSWRGGQDGVIFHCTVVVMLHYLEHLDTNLRCSHHGHGGLPHCVVHLDRLANR
jgi:hypothetical protein